MTADRTTAETRWLPIAVLALVALVYAPSLSGEWIWDDVPQYATNPAIGDPWTLMTTDIWEPTGFKDDDNTPVYRPLAMLSHVPGQVWWTGPFVERIVNLALHLGVTALIAGLALAAGAPLRAAWLGAALFGVHPAATEGVAWISSRGDLMGTALVLGAALAFVRERSVWAAGLLAVAPFCKETFLLAPVSLGVWMIGARRFDAIALVGALAGAVGYLAVRHGLEIEVPPGSPFEGIGAAIASIGAIAARTLELAIVPTSPDALEPYQARLGFGIAGLALALAALPHLRGRPPLWLLWSTLPLLAPAAPASFANEIVADRYFYVALALAATALGLALAPWISRPTVVAAGVAGIALLTPFATTRAYDWTTNERLFTASLERRPDSARAQFEVAYELHVRQNDCERAAPLYYEAHEEDARAANNLLACWIALGRFEEITQLGPTLAARSDRPNLASNTARGFSAVGDQHSAEQWVREAIARGGPSAGRLALLGNILGLQGQHEAALASFEAAIRQDPRHPDANRGRAIAMRALEAGDDS